jgi:hypothetical protein
MTISSPVNESSADMMSIMVLLCCYISDPPCLEICLMGNSRRFLLYLHWDNH